MAKLHRAILCDAVVKTSGKENLLGVFVRWYADGLPTTCPPFALHTCVDATKGPHVFKVQVADEFDKPLGNPTLIPFNITAGEIHDGHIINVYFNNFVIVKFGTLRFMLSVDDEFVGEAVAHVEQLQNKNRQEQS